MKRLVIPLSLITLALGMWMWCVTNADQLASYAEVVELAYKEEALDVATVKAMKKGEEEGEESVVRAFVAWREEMGQQLENTELNRTAEGRIITFYGDMSLLTVGKEIDGTPVYADDKEGVVITSALAYNLWGDTRVVGQEVTMGDKTYRVRGVVEEKEAAAFKYEDAEDAYYGTLRLQMRDVDNIRDNVQTLGFRYSLPEGVIRNFSLATVLVEHATRLPIWILGIYGLLRVYKYIYGVRDKKPLFYGLCIVALVCTFVVLQLINIKLNIPDYMMPSKWSDFGFWVKEIEGFWKNKEELGMMATYLPLRWYQKMMWQFGLSLVTTIGLEYVIHRYLFVRKNDKIKLIHSRNQGVRDDV